ncbi:cutinase-domain-containing protein [Podospora fimiseda]|uniref:Cutinase-domain-containing protein n=1 Tax=Podospora fimiseda TaxID=252190 RepID=A0AAN7BKJ0_9PEZI|nr:cutinase-domain-containing protein [Podospora fimiseda]
MKEILSQAVTALAAILQTRDTLLWDGKCATGVHIIVARGSTEAPGMGRAAPVARNATLLVPGSSIVTVDYPATFENYFISQAAGAAGFERLVLQHVEACPNTKIALIGYSQGAHALMDAICGAAGDAYQVSEKLTMALKEQVIASVGFGDPSHTAGAPWNAGTSNKTGLFARNNVTACEPYADRIRSYCDTGDIYCDLGDDAAIHGSYFANYSIAAADFIATQYMTIQLKNETVPAGDASSPDTPVKSGAKSLNRASWVGVVAGVVGTIGFLGML